MAGILTTLITCLMLASATLHAFEDSPIYSINFRVFGVGNDRFEELYYYNGSAYAPLIFHKVSRSLQTYNYKGTEDFWIFVKNPEYDPGALHSQEFKPIAHTRLTCNLENGLLVFYAYGSSENSALGGRHFQLYLLDDRTDSFPRNSIVLVNATGVDLIANLGGTQTTLATGISAPIPFIETSSGKGTNLALALQTAAGFRLVMSNDIQLSDNRRIVMILMPPEKQDSVRIRTRTLSQSVYSDTADIQ